MIDHLRPGEDVEPLSICADCGRPGMAVTWRDDSVARRCRHCGHVEEDTWT